MAEMAFDVKGMSCEHCRRAVEKALASLESVDRVEVDLQPGRVRVEYEEGRLSQEDLKRAVREAGYEA